MSNNLDHIPQIAQGHKFLVGDHRDMRGYLLKIYNHHHYIWGSLQVVYNLLDHKNLDHFVLLYMRYHKDQPYRSYHNILDYMVVLVVALHNQETMWVYSSLLCSHPMSVRVLSVHSCLLHWWVQWPVHSWEHPHQHKFLRGDFLGNLYLEYNHQQYIPMPVKIYYIHKHHYMGGPLEVEDNILDHNNRLLPRHMRSYKDQLYRSYRQNHNNIDY